MAARSAKHIDLDYLSNMNEARDQIMALERDDSNGAGSVFIIPLSKEFAPQNITLAPGRLIACPPRIPIFQGGEQVSEVIRTLRCTALHELLTALD